MAETKKKQESNSSKFKKSNLLIGSKYQSSLLENKLLAAALANIQQTYVDTDGSIVSEMTPTEIKRLLGTDNDTNIYKKLDSVASQMTGRTVGMKNPENNSFSYVAIIIDSTYKDGVFRIRFNSLLKELLVTIQKNYTLLSLPVMMSFKSVYSFRLYELVRSESFFGNHAVQFSIPTGTYTVYIGLSELRLELGLVNANEDKVKKLLNGKKFPDYDKAVEIAMEKHFEKWSDFKKKVLDVAVPEINAKTDIRLEYVPRRSGLGGKTVGVEFKIQYKVEDENTLNNALSAEVEDKNTYDGEIISGVEDKNTYDAVLVAQVIDLIDEKLSSADIGNLLKAAGNDIDKIRKAYGLAKKQGNIKNLTGWLLSAIQNGYEEPVSMKKKKAGVGANFKERSYSDKYFEDIETRLLQQ